MFGAVAAEPVPDALLRLIREDRSEPEEFWSGPSYSHRGARIECGPGGYVCRLLMVGHPLDGQAFGPAGIGVLLIDVWLDEGLLPDDTQVPWAGSGRTGRTALPPCPANGTPAALGDCCTVHVVDDDEPIRRAAAVLLRSAGIPARTHPCGRTLLSTLPAIEGSGAGCVLADLWMPDLDGLELLRRLRERGFQRPVIIMAEDGDIPTAVRVMKAGAADFLKKPFCSEALLAAIGAALAAPGPHMVDAASEAAARIAVLSRREGEVLELLAAGDSVIVRRQVPFARLGEWHIIAA
jgi:two-component system response regulator FixJ